MASQMTCVRARQTSHTLDREDHHVLRPKTSKSPEEVAGRDWALHNAPISETGGKALGELKCCSNPRRGANACSCSMLTIMVIFILYTR